LFSERELYAIARPSVCRLSVCLSSVTFLRPRGVTTAGDTGDASPVRPTTSPLHQNDNRQFVFRADLTSDVALYYSV